MIYLLAKYTLIFILAALSGFVLGRWLTRRSFVDVSESYEDMREAATRSDAGNWTKLWNRIDALPGHGDVDLAGVSDRLDGVSNALAKIPLPPPVDLRTVENKLDDLGKRLREIPYPITVKPEDLDPIAEKLVVLEEKIDSIPMPETPPAANFTPLVDRLNSIDQTIGQIPEHPPQQSVDLTPVRADLASLREYICSMTVVETHAAVDVEPIRLQMGALERRVHELPQPKSVDLNPINNRLNSIEVELRTLSKQLSKPAVVKTAPAKRKRSEPTILSAALYGKKDDLRLISGVGPKLERLLNKNGVYYFWQVATWSKKDISLMDERLDTFNGRIDRDNWVAQANRLTREDTAAKRPTELSAPSA